MLLRTLEKIPMLFWSLIVEEEEGVEVVVKVVVKVGMRGR
jgi:hypothetical protein